jgi:hypothetical protein
MKPTSVSFLGSLSSSLVYKVGCLLFRPLLSVSLRRRLLDYFRLLWYVYVSLCCLCPVSCASNPVSVSGLAGLNRCPLAFYAAALLLRLRICFAKKPCTRARQTPVAFMHSCLSHVGYSPYFFVRYGMVMSSSDQSEPHFERDHPPKQDPALEWTPYVYSRQMIPAVRKTRPPFFFKRVDRLGGHGSGRTYTKWWRKC